ncbi:MAG: uracil-DNA glycosylase [Candidatus Omnitrophica bacterium]|nr:uracil-DNA glycosylase [Candidatus Omnitrophota bacterium]
MKPSRSISNSKLEQLEPIRRQALVCRACRLAKERTHVVFGEGSLDAKLVFIGEGPGRSEDLQGRPFVGQAGILLTKIIQAMGLQREQVYIANVVKCRPPMNRPPEPDEVAACSGYLKAQLSTIQPKIICALGRTAATALLGSQAPMNQLRGKTFQWEGIPLIVTFHPAYLLRNPAAKPQVWEDMQRILPLLKP